MSIHPRMTVNPEVLKMSGANFWKEEFAVIIVLLFFPPSSYS